MLDDASLATAEFNETGVPTLWYNQYGWTQAANLLIINSPPPVGYSYCDPAGPAGNGSSCGAWNDTRTATHNYEFLVNWFDAFPEYKERELYLSGESYAGNRPVQTLEYSARVHVPDWSQSIDWSCVRCRDLHSDASARDCAPPGQEPDQTSGAFHSCIACPPTDDTFRYLIRASRWVMRYSVAETLPVARFSALNSCTAMPSSRTELLSRSCRYVIHINWRDRCRYLPMVTALKHR
jgi:hypothetical protein